MADKTFTEALAEIELVSGTAGAGQESINGNEVVGASTSTLADAGWTFVTMRAYAATHPDLMLKSQYDSNDNGIVDAANELKDQTSGKSKTADEVYDHIEDLTIHYVINDSSTAVNVAWSASKINTELGLKTDQTDFNLHTGDSDIHVPLDDGAATLSNLWSASKIDTTKVDQSAYDGHVGNTVIHAPINDLSASTTDVWSASKIQGDLNDKADQSALDAHTGTLNIHRVMDDLQTTTTTLWSSSKIDTQKTDQTDFDNHVGDTQHLDANERAAMDAANAPSGTNAFATIDDISAGGGGDVTGPASAVDSNIAAFNGTSGKQIKDAGYAMPAGGASGEVLTKNSATDYDWSWAPGGGGGGIPDAPDDSFGYLREGSTSNTWVRGSRVTEAATAPSTPGVGDVWIDTT